MSGQPLAPAQRAEASGDGLTLTVSFPVPTRGAVVTISAWLRSDTGDREPADGEVWLRIRTPGGNVDRFRMQEPRSAAGTYSAQYAFPTPGLYLVTADARSGAGGAVRAASVTTEVEVGDGWWHDGHHWLAPAAVVGGLGMLAIMVVMMGGSGH